LAGVDYNLALCGSIFDRGMGFIPFSHIIAILPVDRLTEVLEEVASLSVQAQQEPLRLELMRTQRDPGFPRCYG
jgi:hypothetical protein